MKIEYTVKMVTEFDTDHPSVHKFLALDNQKQQKILAEMFADLCTNKGYLDELNEHGSWAVVSFAEVQ